MEATAAPAHAASPHLSPSPCQVVLRWLQKAAFAAELPSELHQSVAVPHKSLVSTAGVARAREGMGAFVP